MCLSVRPSVRASVGLIHAVYFLYFSSIYFYPFLPYFLVVTEQYLMTLHKDVENFPFLSNDHRIACKKAKGVSRTIQQKQLTFHDFESVAVRNELSRKVVSASIRKVNYRIYLVKNKKKLLTNFTSKRLFSPEFRTKKYFFSFPLHLLKVVKDYTDRRHKCA